MTRLSSHHFLSTIIHSPSAATLQIDKIQSTRLPFNPHESAHIQSHSVTLVRRFLCDLDFDRMTLTYKLETFRIYIHKQKIADPRSMISKVRAWTGQTGTQTDRRDRTYYHSAFAGGDNRKPSAITRHWRCHARYLTEIYGLITIKVLKADFSK